MDDDTPRFAVFYLDEPEPERRIQWGAVRGLQLAPDDEELIEGLVNNLAEWLPWRARMPEGLTIRMRLTLKQAPERVLVENERRPGGADGLDVEKEDDDTATRRLLAALRDEPGFMVKIKRSGVPDRRLHIVYGHNSVDEWCTCMVLEYGLAE